MVPVEHRRNGGDFFREQLQVELRAAVLHHAAQQAGVLDATLRAVDGAAVAADLAGVALGALVFCDELGAQGQVGAFEDIGALGLHEQGYEQGEGEQGGLHGFSSVGRAGCRDQRN